MRSWSIFGLSTVEMVFGEDTTDFENRERFLNGLSARCFQVSFPGWGPTEPGWTNLFLHSGKFEP